MIMILPSVLVWLSLLGNGSDALLSRLHISIQFVPKFVALYDHQQDKNLSETFHLSKISIKEALTVSTQVGFPGCCCKHQNNK